MYINLITVSRNDIHSSNHAQKVQYKRQQETILICNTNMLSSLHVLCQNQNDTYKRLKCDFMNASENSITRINIPINYYYLILSLNVKCNTKQTIWKYIKM